MIVPVIPTALLTKVILVSVSQSRVTRNTRPTHTLKGCNTCSIEFVHTDVLHSANLLTSPFLFPAKRKKHCQDESYSPAAKPLLFT